MRDLGWRPRARARSRGDKTTGCGFGTRAHAPVLVWSRVFAGASWSRSALLGFIGVCPGFVGFYRVCVGFIGWFWWVLSGFIGLWWALVGSGGLLVGFGGLWWALVGSSALIRVDVGLASASSINRKESKQPRYTGIKRN